MAKKRDTLRGSDGFETYYTDLFGNRWPNLRDALLGQPSYISWNPFNAEEPYFMDSGSVLAAFSLPLDTSLMLEESTNSDEILNCADFCAAPGGKTLVLASRLSNLSNNWHLTSNERSNNRRSRLIRNTEQLLPEKVREHIKITGFDAARWCKYETETFDRVFVDAPCSSERHVLSDSKYLAQWSPSRIKTLAQTQWSILSSAYRVLKTNGYLVYATCALSPLENDEVIARLLKKFDTAKVVSKQIKDIKKAATKENFYTIIEQLPEPEITEFGFQILPDSQNGAGPMYFCIINKMDLKI
jgi:16S rRNA C967 or C1407 C5-methylase (RsmB/RsmF family)